MGVVYDVMNDKFSSDGYRPGGHLNLGVLQAIVKDIIAQTPLTQGEQDLIDEYDPTGTGNAYKIAKAMKSKKFLSTYGYAICHKIPYAGVERSLLKLLQLNPASTHVAWTRLSFLLQGLHGVGYSSLAAASISKLQKGLASNSTKSLAAAEVNDILSEFDQSADNLYVGFAQTNSSIGDSIDKHYDILTPGTTAVAATPRGANLETLLNTFESSLGMLLTKPVQVSQKSIKWEESSSVGGIGWVVIV